MIEGTAILVITLGKGSYSIICSRWACWALLFSDTLSSPKYHLLLFHMILLYRKMKTCQLFFESL